MNSMFLLKPLTDRLSSSEDVGLRNGDSDLIDLRTVPAVTQSSHFLPVLQLSINDANEMRSLTHFEISLNEKVPWIKVNCDADCWAEPLVCPRITVSVTWEASGYNRGYESICAGPWNQQAVMRICSTWETKLWERAVGGLYINMFFI